MSADKRKQILIVFAGLAVVLVGVIAYVSPNFRNEDVSGAIGAVQKHREPQITPQDVVLGDEKVKQEEQILYANFLTDAAALRNLSADLLSAEPLNEARMQSDEQSLAARRDELNRRFVESMNASIVETKKIANEDREAALGRKKLDAILAEAEALARAVRDSETLASQDMEQLSVRLAAMVESFSWGAKKREAGKADLVNSEANLQRMIRNADEEGAKAAFAKAMDSLEARSSAMRVRNQVDYLAAIAKEAKAVASVEAALANEEQLAARKGIIAILIGQADQLEARAFNNMEEQMASDAELSAHLNRMISLASDDQLARRKLEDMQSELNARVSARTSYQLAQFDAQLQAREALNARLTNDAELSRRLQNDESLAAMREQLARMSKVEGRSVQAKALEQRAIGLESRKK